MSDTATPEKRPPVNYVFVDGENVPGIDLSFIEERTVHLMLLLGPQQKKIDAELVEKLLTNAPSVKLIRLENPGKNALDFTLAYYLGRAVQENPSAYFHLVSKDTGFDALIEHLKMRHIHIRQHADASTLPFGCPQQTTKESTAIALPEATVKIKTKAPALLGKTLEHLRKQGEKRPKTRKKLISDLKSHAGKDAKEPQIIKLVEQLEKGGHLTIDDKQRVTYQLK